MGILIDQTTRVLLQGITGHAGRVLAAKMQSYGTQVVAGVTPGRGGQTVGDIPVFDTVKSAVEQTGASASLITVQAPFAADAIMEAADGGINLAIAITDGIPAQDMIRVNRYMRRYREEHRMRLLGPNCAGVINPGKCLLGIMPTAIYSPGPVGVVGRSGTLSYEAAAQLQELEIGISTSVGIGGDSITGSSFLDILKLFEADKATDAVVLVGEIGGPQEAEAADYIRDAMTKPVVAYIAGISAPRGRRMGHAGAIISAFGESADEKVELLRHAGAIIVPNPAEIGATVAAAMTTALA